MEIIMRLSNKTALVTASTRGIGFEIVKAFAKEGARVYMAARNMERAGECAALMSGEGLNVSAVFNDAEKPESFSSAVEEVVSREGRLDILVNNFGTSDPRVDLDFMNTSPDVFLGTVEINLRSVFLSSQAAARHMSRGNGGSIINISSIGGSVPDISQTAYGTSKAAINYLTKLIALQGAKYNIRANALLPGMTATEAVREKLTDRFKDLFLRHIPLGRMGLPEEIAHAAVYFASDESKYTTGQILSISGGFGLGTPVYAELYRGEDRR